MSDSTIGRTVRAFLLVAAAAATAAGCAGRKSDGRPQVGVTLLTQAHVFYQDLQKGLQARADSDGIDLHVVAGEWDLSRQTSQVENFITRKMDAIVIAPVNSSGIVSAVQEANDAGIPVFTVDIAADGGHVVSHIASDNRQGGRLLARYLAGRLGGHGNVAILDQPTVTSVQDRVAGFREGLTGYPDIHVVADPAVERGLRDVAKDKTDNLLATGKKIDAIFGSNDDCALGALASVEASGRTGILIVGFDATPEARSAIARGTPLVADAVQHPAEIGRRAIDVIARRLRGDSVPARVAVPVGIVTRDSLAARGGAADGGAAAGSGAAGGRP
ncbi:MAG: substrate-binding domain-containing protein [Candidatus Palauibacterales bacterium]|nr:substrate-binding domain-containing protein [Candidatus Palauibacterales bacterium]MDP2528458.1 substrate-binding domain-containing protein [Candidatus Palauibacterales bacterium]MDP2584453.1 substrate-binding domain-containing protein [Candidatus Palauibacterales bacterium]